MIITDSHQSNTFEDSLGVFDGIKLTRVGNNLFFGKVRVHPEFENLMRLDFHTHTTIRFNKHSLKREHSEHERYDLIAGIFKSLNLKIRLKYPSVDTGKHTVRYCWVNEYGASEDEVHMHILGYIKPGTSQKIYHKAYNYLKYIQKKIQVENKRYNENRNSKMPIIQSVKTSKIRNQSGIVSYFCKIEHLHGKDNFKLIGYSIGFKSIIEKFYPKQSIQCRLK